MPSLEPMYFTQLAHALDSMKMSDHVTISHLEHVMDPDSVPELADYMVRMAGVMWSLVTGQYESSLYLSIRSTDPAANLVDNDLQIDFTATGSTLEAVTIASDGTTFTLGGNITGTTSFSVASVTRITILASGNSTAQSMTFDNAAR